MAGKQLYGPNMGRPNSVLVVNRGRGLYELVVDGAILATITRGTDEFWRVDYQLSAGQGNFTSRKLLGLGNARAWAMSHLEQIIDGEAPDAS